MSGTEQPGGVAAPAEEYRPTDVLSSEPEEGGQGQGGQAAGGQGGAQTPPQPGEGEQPKPGEGEQAKPGEEGKPDPAEEKAARDRAAVEARIAQLSRTRAEANTAREAAEARAAALEARLRQFEAPGQPAGQSIEEQIKAGIEQGLAQREQQQRVQAWDAAGRKAYPDWQQRCSDLVELGASTIAPILVEMGPDGAAVTGELAQDPVELARILALPTERARALALGQFAAGISSRQAQQPAVTARQVSQMPAPIRPPANARGLGEPNPEADMDSYFRWSAKQTWSR